MSYSVQIVVPVPTDDGVGLRVDVESPHLFNSLGEALRWIDVFRSIWRAGLLPGEPRLLGIVYGADGKHVCGLGYGCEDTPRKRRGKYHGRLYSADELTAFWLSRGTTIHPFTPDEPSPDVTHDMTDRAEPAHGAAA